jgi:nicotinamidase-related amidase
VIAAAPLPPRHTALLMIGAEAYIDRRASGAPPPELEDAAGLLHHARGAGAHVLHVRRVQGGDPQREPRRHTGGKHRRRRAVLASDETVIDAHGASPFADTGLQRELAARGVEAVIVAGVMTPSSCSATANEALARNYRTVIPSELMNERTREAETRRGAEVLSLESIHILMTAAAEPG